MKIISTAEAVYSIRTWYILVYISEVTSIRSALFQDLCMITMERLIHNKLFSTFCDTVRRLTITIYFSMKKSHWHHDGKLNLKKINLKWIIEIWQITNVWHICVVDKVTGMMWFWYVSKKHFVCVCVCVHITFKRLLRMLSFDFCNSRTDLKKLFSLNIIDLLAQIVMV